MMNKKKAYERSSGDKQKEKVYGRTGGSHRDSESGQKASDKRKGSLHEDELREKTAQKILRRRKDETMLMRITDASSRLDLAMHSVPVTEEGIILKGEECAKVVF